MRDTKKVFVGLSGGVDSAVAAARLIATGYDVTGVFIKVWHPDFLVCNWEAERLDAMRVAAHLNIPFLTCDAEAAYRDEVAHYFIEEYKAGRTPNPDVMCNQHVKFGAFLRFAKERGADYIATGHYARKVTVKFGSELWRGIDVGKDQTYFLWSLTPEQLEAALFPIGDTPKEQIRDEAQQLGLPVATKKDSQGICFLGHIDIADFLSHYTKLTIGPVLNEAGEVIGEHQGALVYTLGQRHGFTLNTNDTAREPMFVIARDIVANTITAGPHRELLHPSENLLLRKVTLRTSVFPGEEIEVQFRYRQKPLLATIIKKSEDDLSLRVVGDVERPSSGQSCVLYRGPHCLGGGIID